MNTKARRHKVLNSKEYSSCLCVFVFKIWKLCIVLYLWPIGISFAQDSLPQKFRLSGYVSDLGSVQHFNSSSQFENLLHNRLNFNWMPNSNLMVNIELRNRLIVSGQQQLSAYKQTMGDDYGLVDLATNLTTGSDYILNMLVDRFNVSYEYDKFKLSLGRQRINWGQTLVWNPNDVFNVYSFFDFDYVERPGSDALRLQYFNTETSVTEFVTKVNRDHEITSAGLYRFNAAGYDWQVIGGVLNSHDWIMGGGWSGAFGPVSFRGESSYFKAIENKADTANVFQAALGFDYSFPSLFTIQLEALYNDGPQANMSNMMNYYNAPLSVKNMAFGKYNAMAQVSYPLTPLINASFASMYMHDVKGWYAGPSVSYSILSNLDLSLIGQFFSIEMTGLGRVEYLMGFARLKYSF